MKLLIVESPSKAKTISKYLGTGYKVVASVGHVRDLPKSNKIAIDMEHGFKPHYEISKGKEKVIDEIRALAKDADEVYLATDPDREGEAIAWHIVEAAGLKDKKTKDTNPKVERIVFHEITKEAVEEALKHPRNIDQHLREAQEARRVLDRLVGYDLSGLIWKKVRYGLSAGRVQSPALRIVMEREREIRAFNPETFWVISAKTKNKSGVEIIFICAEEPRDKARMEAIEKEAKAGDWKIASIKETQVTRSPRAPFTTSTLQQGASSRLGFSPSRTMQIAQKLYEAGHITYMRTDSVHMSEVAMGQMATVIAKEYGDKYVVSRKYSTKSKNAQEAHEAVRPSHPAVMSAGTTPEQKRLYELIWQRAIASQMADAKVLRTKVTAGFSKDESMPEFSVTGSRVIFDGWLAADTGARGEDVELPKLAVEDPLSLLEVVTEEKQTTPPDRYSEAGLVKELEKRGIGRPSTYASIIKTLLDRMYVTKEGKALKPTDTGEVVSGFLEKNFNDYINDTFTAEMEDKLDAIARGEKDYESTLSAFYKPFSKDVKEKSKSADKITDLGPGPKELKCPVCGSPMIWKLSRNGKFLSCSRFPDCQGALTAEGKEIKTAEPIGTDPVTNEPVFIKIGRFGPYVQLGEMKKVGKKKVKPKMASIPKEKNPETVTIEDALRYLTLPRILGNHPDTNQPITAAIGRFGPFVVHQADFRSLKTDDVYTIELPRALEIFKEPKKVGVRGRRKKEAETK